MLRNRLSDHCITCGDMQAAVMVTIDGNPLELLAKIKKYLPLLQIEATNTVNNVSDRCCRDCVDAICSWDTFYTRCEQIHNRDVATLFGSSNTCDKNVAGKENSESERGNDNNSEREYVPERLMSETVGLPDLTKAQHDNMTLYQEFEEPNLSQLPVSDSHQKMCHFCDYAQSTPDKYNEHLIDSHSEEIFCCDICDQYFPLLQLLSHMSAHANMSTNVEGDCPTLKVKNGFKCEKCQKIFRSLSGIQYHMNSQHVRLQVFKCDLCHQNFTSKRVLLNHKRSIHNNETRAYVCPDCGKAFKTDSTLYTHRKMHQDDKPHKCPLCEKRFRLKHHLTSHMVQHRKFTDHPNWECNFCHKKFAGSDNLRKHRKIHERTIRDYVCHICNAKMRQKRYLREHMKKVHLQALRS